MSASVDRGTGGGSCGKALAAAAEQWPQRAVVMDGPSGLSTHPSRAAALRHGALLTALCVLVSQVVFAGAAHATILARFQETYPAEGTYTCGAGDDAFEVQWAGEFTEQVLLREGKAQNTAVPFWFANIRYTFEWIHTNADTGKSVTEAGRGVIQELNARHVGGTVYEYWLIDAGQKFTIADASGQVILRDRGTLRERWEYDSATNRWTRTTTEVRGPHPSLSGIDFCALLAND
jgi:hypothetical protein